METLEAIRLRTSIRSFKDDSVEPEKIERIIKAGLSAPSALDRRPWEIYVIDNNDIMKKITDISPNFDKKSPIQLVVVGKLDYIKDNNVLDYWIEDCAAVTENILLAATDLGLGSLWCGVFPREERCKAIKDILGLKDSEVAFSFIHIGYAKEYVEPKNKYDESKIHYIK